MQADPALLASVAHLRPVHAAFGFQSPDGFERGAREVVTPWLPRLAGERFHVRMHRRGFKGRLFSQEEERFLGAFVLRELAARGQSATVGFDDPGRIIAVDTVGQRAGLGLWSRAERERYPFLGLD